jgi:hypothetical protein
MIVMSTVVIYMYIIYVCVRGSSHDVSMSVQGGLTWKQREEDERRQKEVCAITCPCADHAHTLLTGTGVFDAYMMIATH